MTQNGKINMALDDIINENRSQYRRGGIRRGGRPIASRGGRATIGRRGGGATGFRRGRAVPDGRWTHDRFDEEDFDISPRLGRSVGGGTTKLVISNLDYGVSEADVKELFSEFGPLRRAVIHYDKSGRSLGTADIIFERRIDAVRSLKEYDGVPLDGRPMKIQIEGETPLGRVTATSTFGITRGQSLSGRRRGVGSRMGTLTNARGRGGARRGRRGEKKPSMTAEQLDNDLDSYIKKAA